MKTNNWRTPLLNWEKYSWPVKMMMIFKSEDCITILRMIVTMMMMTKIMMVMSGYGSYEALQKRTDGLQLERAASKR